MDARMTDKFIGEKMLKKWWKAINKKRRRRKKE
jgi:hypothetical protein